jgi:integrase/recombinase XerD
MNGKLSYKIIIKDDYIREDGTCALYIQIFMNKERKRIPLFISVEPKHFDKVKQRVRAANKLYKDYNLIIEKKLAEINSIEVNYRLGDRNLDLTRLLDEINSPTARIDFIKFWTDEMVRQKDILRAGTYRQQMTMLNKTKGFKNPIYFQEINEDFIQDLKSHCKKKLKNTDPTIATLIKSFKKYLHIAQRRGINAPIKIDEIKVKSFKGNRTFLMPEEINLMDEYYNSKFIKQIHKDILSRFLFSCFTGLRISDIKNLKSENISNNILFFTSIKSNTIQRVQMNLSAQKYIDPVYLFHGDYTEEYFNRELKEIAKFLNINKKISFHVSRHTFATNYLICGGNVVNLQKILGHSEIKTTMLYVHIVDEISDIEIHNMDDILN